MRTIGAVRSKGIIMKTSPEQRYAAGQGQRTINLCLGCKVTLQRRCKDYQGGWRGVWTNAMIENIGKVGTILRRDSRFGIKVQFDNGAFYFPHFVLEEVETKPKKRRTK